MLEEIKQEPADEMDPVHSNEGTAIDAWIGLAISTCTRCVLRVIHPSPFVDMYTSPVQADDSSRLRLIKLNSSLKRLSLLLCKQNGL